jgi:hypothetical protein
MAEGAFIVLSDPVAKKEAAYHEWYADFVERVQKISGVTSAQRFTLAATQVDVRPMNLNLTVFELSDVEGVRALFAEQFGVRTATEFLRLSDSVDQSTMMTTFYEVASERLAAPNASVLPVEQQNIIIQVLSVPLEIRPHFIETYIVERLNKLIHVPGLISGQLYKMSQVQVQNVIYPYVGLYRNSDGKEALQTWPVPATNWKSLAAAREKDPALRPDGKLAGMQNRDFLFEPYVAPVPPEPKPA